MVGPSDGYSKLPTSHVLEKFRDELYCPICKDFLSDPMLTKECLHRFCAQCIQREIARGLRHCPSCRRELPKKVPFKSDPNFASILGKLISQQKELSMRDAVETMRQNGTNISFYKRNLAPNNLKSDNSRLSPHFPEECDLLEQSSKNSAENGCSSSDTAAKCPRLCEENSLNGSSSSDTAVHASATAKKAVEDESASLPENSFPQNSTKAESSHKSSTPPPSLTTYERESTLTSEKGAEAAATTASESTQQQQQQQQLCQQQQQWGEKQRLNRENAIPLILWPDGSIFRNKQLPVYLQQPKYIYVPPDTTVAHLAEYLLIRTEVETAWKNGNKYRVEITAVEDERDEFELLMREANKVDYLTFADASIKGDYTLKLANNNAAPNIMLTLAHPFRAAPGALAVLDLLAATRANERRARRRQRPPKVVYRFVEAK